MTVMVPVELTQEEQLALQLEAAARGVSVDELVRSAVLRAISGSHAPAGQLTTDEFERVLGELANLVPAGVPPVPDEALSRESIYTREDEW